MANDNHEDPRKSGVPGFMTTDIHPVLVSLPERYAIRAEGPVRYLSVATSEGVIGYLWFSDAEDAAGLVLRTPATDDALNAKVSWAAALRSARKRGLSPSEAIGEASSSGGNDVMGRVVADSGADAATLDELKALAAE